ncbi:hypothetical protein KKA39_02430 [Patescibacteria group bacterium]|nr:hypothetical protein [Patescibacteria group bacterium]MBU1728134.1 hypothetical protein [Patescibacteria group bacterium]
MINPYVDYKMPLPILVLIVVWTLFWKIYAVWTAVKNNHKGWFVAVLILNTFGILEIIYLFYIAKKKWSDVKRVFVGMVIPKKNLKKKESIPTEEEVK